MEQVCADPLEEQVCSIRALSGYTGVTTKREKWKAYIKYKGQNIDLGCYTNLKDAVKARARGKEIVRADAAGLLDFYGELHKNDLLVPDRAKRKIPFCAVLTAMEKDNRIN